MWFYHAHNLVLEEVQMQTLLMSAVMIVRQGKDRGMYTHSEQIIFDSKDTSDFETQVLKVLATLSDEAKGQVLAMSHTFIPVPA